MSGSARGTADIRYDSDFSRIEELIKGNSFSREEISRLVEILNSRVDDAREKQKSIIDAEAHAPLTTWTHENQRTPAQQKHQAIDRTMIGTIQMNVDVSPEVGASPIDIARAYMASRTSDGGLDHDNVLSKCERAQLSKEFTRKQLLPSPCPKPSICWPGAMVPDSHGYATPQSQKGKPKLLDFRRTPYSRTTLSKSTTQVQAELGYPYTSSTPFQSSQSSVYDQVKTGGNNVDGYGSVGPIRRIRNKFASEVRPRGSVFRSSSTGFPSLNATPTDFGVFSTSRDLEPGEISGASKKWSGDYVPIPSDKVVSNSHLSSSQAARKMLEHLDRNKPTPKEKETELKMVKSWRKSPFEANDTVNKDSINSVHIGEPASHKNIDAAVQNILEEINKSSKYNFTANYHDKGTDEASNVVNGNATASGSVSTGFKISSGRNFLPSFANMGTSGPAVKAFNKSVFAATTNHAQSQTNSLFSRPPASDGQVLTMAASSIGSELTKDNANKPSLASISVNRPDFRSAHFDNGPGFTFPISASSGALSELPTPSITPPSSASFLSQPVCGVSTELPPYSFGTNKSSPRLVFSFPSSSSAPANVDADMKFSFGSEKTTERLSFSSFGKDAICY